MLMSLKCVRYMQPVVRWLFTPNNFGEFDSAMRHECQLRDGAPTVARMPTRPGAIDQR